MNCLEIEKIKSDGYLQAIQEIDEKVKELPVYEDKYIKLEDLMKIIHRWGK